MGLSILKMNPFRPLTGGLHRGDLKFKITHLPIALSDSLQTRNVSASSLWEEAYLKWARSFTSRSTLKFQKATAHLRFEMLLWLLRMYISIAVKIKCSLFLKKSSI